MNTRSRGLHALSFLLVSTLLAQGTWSGIGDVDMRFGESGTLRIPAGYSIPYPGPGSTLRLYSISDDELQVLQLDALGTPDPSFGQNGTQTSTIGFDGSGVSQVWPGQGSTAYLSVTGSDADSQYLLKLDATGRPDPAFGESGAAAFPAAAIPGARYSIVDAVLPMADGSIYVLVGSYESYYDCALKVELHRLDRSGAPDPSFGTDGSIDYPDNGCFEMGFGRIVPLDGGRVYVASSANRFVDPSGGLSEPMPSGPNRTLDWTGDSVYALRDRVHLIARRSASSTEFVVSRWNGKPELDITYGVPDSGDVIVDFAPALTGTPAESWSGWMHPHAAGPFTYLSLRSYRSFDGGPRSVIARLSDDGVLDRAFGQAGFVTSMEDFRQLVEIEDGSLVVVTFGGVAHRLLNEDTDSAGRLATNLYCGGVRSADEKEGHLSVVVARELGNSGPVTLEYRTVANSAVPGVHYEETRGSIRWREGESGARTFEVPLIEDAKFEEPKFFDVHFELSEGSVALPCPMGAVAIVDEEPPTAPPPASSPGGGGNSGGGGGMDMMLLALIGLLWISSVLQSTGCRRGSQRAP